MPSVFYLYSVIALVLTGNALRRPNPRSRVPTWWLPAMVVGEFAPLLLVARLGLGVVFLWAGAGRGPVGQLATAFWLASVLGLSVLIVQTRLSVVRLRREVAPARRVDGSWWDMLRHRLPGEVDLRCGVVYSDGLTLDVYRRKDHNGAPSPTLVYIHGGGWTGGDPHRQARTLFHHLAQRDWVVLTIRYPLSPAATFPDHIVAVKQALAWAKTSGRSLGVNPARLVVSGGSAGGHLASLAALTADNLRLQPGFEEVDTSVAGCVPMYGVYDFLNRNGTRNNWPVIPQAVMKTAPDEAPDAYRLASPLDQIHPRVPPFLVVHGERDSLVPPQEARQFVERLRSISHSVVEYLEVGGGQHAFDAVHSPRTRAVVGAITQFLETRIGLVEGIE